MAMQDTKTTTSNELPGPNMRHGPGPELMGASTLIGNKVQNHADEQLGDIKEIMLDTRTGAVSYAVLSFGGLFGMGNKLFAVPWGALSLDPKNRCFVLDVEKERLNEAPGFDRTKWPDMSDPSWAKQIDAYYENDTKVESSRISER